MVKMCTFLKNEIGTIAYYLLHICVKFFAVLRTPGHKGNISKSKVALAKKSIHSQTDLEKGLHLAYASDVVSGH